MKLLNCFLLSFFVTAAANATSISCKVTKGGFDVDSEISFSGNTNSRIETQWTNSLGKYEISVFEGLKPGQNPAYPLGTIEINFTKHHNNLFTNVYSAAIYPSGVTNGSFWAEGLDKNNLISYQCMAN